MRIHKKIKGPTEIRTRVNGFKDRCDNHYNIGPNVYNHRCPQLVLPQLILTEVSDVILFHYAD